MLSLELGRRLQVPVVHLDQLRFRSGWQSVETAELLGHEQRALPRDGRWIADGNNGATMETRLAAADTIIFLDLATHTCVYRWLWRRMRYAGRVAPGLPAGCRQELLPGARFREILRYVLRFRRKQRPRIVDRLERVDGGQRVIALRTPREVDDFLAAL